MAARVWIDQIKASVADEFDVPLLEMTSDRRHRQVARPRQVAMALACELTTSSIPLIGKLFGGRDHTPVLYARRRVAQLRAGDGDFDRRIRRVERRICEPISPAWPASDQDRQLAFLDGPLLDWSDHRSPRVGGDEVSTPELRP
jgi:hypothetical protein